jgi:hypothetical protein
MKPSSSQSALKENRWTKQIKTNQTTAAKSSNLIIFFSNKKAIIIALYYIVLARVVKVKMRGPENCFEIKTKTNFTNSARLVL